MHFRFGFIVCALAASAVCGCGGTAYDSVPVSGTVTYKGTAVEGATVAFHGGPASAPATGVTDATGKFKLSSYNPGDGAPAGNYKVTVSKKKLEVATSGKMSMEEAAKAPGGSAAKETDLLPPKYASQETTTLTATVEKGKTNDVKLTLED